jgi:hypothetical protein
VTNGAVPGTPYYMAGRRVEFVKGQ